MIDLSYTQYIGPLLILIVSFILVYAGLKKSSIPGSDMVLAILSLVISLLLVSSISSVKYLISLIPLLTLIVVISMLIFVMVALFVSKDFNPFNKSLAWISFGVAIIIIVFLAFNQFSTLNHMLPYSSDYGLDSNMREFKDFLYDSHWLKDTVIFLVAVGLVFFFLVKKAK